MEATENMSWLVEEIRDTALGLRMVQIGETFNRFRRVVREFSRDIGKEIELRISGGDTELDKTVVVQFGDQRAGLVVDELLGEYQTVIKPLGKVFQHLKGISGATILGSGEVAMIVDVPALIQQVAARAANAAGGFGRGEPPRTH